jgi:hypothetical protein
VPSGPVVGELLPRGDVAKRDEGDLTADAEVGLTGVVDEELVAADLVARERADVEVVVDLDVRDRGARRRSG